jgi:NADH-quinone oxidoreductase subunit I
MIVERKKLNLWERLYLPAIAGGFRVTLRHFFKRKVTMQYPEEKWVVPPKTIAARPISCATRMATPSASRASFANSSARPRPSKSFRPARPAGWPIVRTRKRCRSEFEINMLRCIFCGFCQEVCPEEAIFLQKDYSLTGTSREEMIYNKEKLLALGGTVGGVQKWKHKLEEAKEQENFPVKV